MRRIIFTLSFIFIFFSVFTSKAQNDIQMKDTIIHTKKPLMLTFGLDLNIKTFSVDYLHNYTGEYNLNGTGPNGWEWATHKADYSNILPYGPFTNIKLDVMIANSKIFQAGLSYNFGIATIPETDFDASGNATTNAGNPQSVDYVGICLTTEYNYYFNKKKYLGPFVYGGLDLGFYSGSDNVFGTGTPLYLQGRLGFGFDFKHDLMLKAFISSDHLIYWERETSEVFQRPQTLDINLDALYFGLGISKTFTLYPD